eukprot:3283758-Amphidinium_carterae.1
MAGFLTSTSHRKTVDAEAEVAAPSTSAVKAFRKEPIQSANGLLLTMSKTKLFAEVVCNA